MKYQALFLQKIKAKKLKCHLLQFLFGTLSIKIHISEFLLLSFPGYTIDESKVLGGEACLWAEYIDNENLMSTLW